MAENKKPLNIFLKMRNARLEMLLKTIKENPQTPIHKICADLSLETGVTTKKFREYLQLLIDSGKVRIEMGGLDKYAEYAVAEEPQ